MKKIKSIILRIYFLLMIFSFTIIVNIYISKSNTYKIKEIIINGNNYLNDESIKENISHDTNNKDIFNINIKNIKNNIEKNDYIFSCIVSKELPSTLIISIQEIKPLALITIDNKIYFLNQNMDKVKTDINSMNHFSDIPVITNLTDKNTDISKIKYILQQVINKSNIYNKLSEIQFLGSDIILVLSNNTKIIMADNNYKSNLEKLFEFNNQIILKNNNYLEKYNYINMKILNQIIINEKQINI